MIFNPPLEMQDLPDWRERPQVIIRGRMGREQTRYGAIAQSFFAFALH